MIASSIVRIDTGLGPPNVVLTYDDGPEPVGTHEVLSALADSGVNATFFLLLSRTRLNPSLVNEILDQGHEIGLHGVDHKSLLEMDPEEVFNRTLAAKQELEQLVARPVIWFRPPYGQQTPKQVEELFRAGLTPVLWDVICRDWEDVTLEERLAGVRAINKPGSILLAHDNIACEPDGVFYDPCPPFSRGELTRSIIEVLHENGFVCCSLSEALKTGEPILELDSQ